MFKSILRQKKEESICFLLYKVKGRISNIERYGIKYSLSNKFVLIKWFKRKYIEMYRDFLLPYPLPFAVISFIILRSIEKGYILENVVTTSPHIDYVINSYLDEGEVKKLMLHLQNNFDELIAINQFVLRKGTRYITLNIDGTICFINGRFPSDFQDFLTIMANSMKNMSKDFIDIDSSTSDVYV